MVEFHPAERRRVDARRRGGPRWQERTEGKTAYVIPRVLNTASARRGRIVITSSITGPITGFPGWTHYGASKCGQLGFLRTAAIELAKYGITVNAVMPGNIVTEGLELLGPEYHRRWPHRFR